MVAGRDDGAGRALVADTGGSLITGMRAEDDLTMLVHFPCHHLEKTASVKVVRLR